MIVRLALGLAAAAGVAAASLTYWFFYDNTEPKQPEFSIEIAELRREATRLGGEAPLRIEVETIARNLVPEIAMVSGARWKKIEMVRNSYRIVWPDRSIVLEAPYDEVSSVMHGPGEYDAAPWGRMLKAMDEASSIIVTHEHLDHIGGIFQNPNRSLHWPKTLLTQELIDGVPEELWSADERRNYGPFVYSGLKAIAPGVVVVSAPGHTRGSQMVYVQRADGKEFLFVGDVASMADNINKERLRSRYVSTFHAQDDRGAVSSQLKALGRLRNSAPELTFVPGHDGAEISRLERAGLLSREFSTGHLGLNAEQDRDAP